MLLVFPPIDWWHFEAVEPLQTRNFPRQQTERYLTADSLPAYPMFVISSQQGLLLNLEAILTNVRPRWKRINKERKSSLCVYKSYDSSALRKKNLNEGQFTQCLKAFVLTIGTLNPAHYKSMISSRRKFPSLGDRKWKQRLQLVGTNSLARF